MGEGQEQQYVEQLRGVFDSFDLSGCGSLSRDELWELCVSLHLQEAAPALLQALLLGQDAHAARVDFEQFKNALILVLSSTIEEPQLEQEPPPKPASPEIQPKFVKGSKRYGRRSTPEFVESASDPRQSGPEGDRDESYESAVPCKRERWNALETSTEEEYEAEGQLHLWNPDEPGTPRGSVCALSDRLEQRVQEGCEELALSWDGFASRNDLLALCQHLGLEVSGEVLQTLNSDAATSVQEFVSRVLNHNKPPTPSASTPYRQLKRMHSTQPFDEGGRRIVTPLALSSTIGLKLFSTLDDGTGFTPVEHVLDSWVEEGIENSTEILQALNFSLEGKLSLSDLTVALETELLETKNDVLQAALASFRAEIRHLLTCVDRELREKEKIQSDLEKAERLKTQLATEVDEHHSAIEHMNKLNLSKLEQEHKEKLSSVRSELMKEMEQMQVQAGAQREELEAEIKKIREDESFLRDHLSISVKENRRLEMELLDMAEKLVEAQNQITKLQTNMDNIMKEKFGDLDPGSVEFFLQEERIKQLHISYEAQCRELQDRIDELQSELNDFHSIGRVHQTGSKTLSEELESTSPGNESDPGLGAEEVQPFSLSLEAEMMLEQLKDRHLQEMDELRDQLENKISEFEELFEKQRTSHEEQKAALAQQHQDELQVLRAEMSRVQTQAEELQTQLEKVQMESSKPEQNQDKELETLQEEEIQTLRQQLLESHIKNADLDEQLRSLEEQQSEMHDSFNKEMEAIKQKHNQEISKLEQTQAEMFAKMEEERSRLSSEFEREKDVLKQNYESEIRAKLDQEQKRFENEKEEIVQQWQKEKAQLDEQNTNNLQVLLEEEMLKLVKEHEDKERELKEQWEIEKVQIQQKFEENLLERLHQQTTEFEHKEKKLKEDWETEKAQLEEDFEGMVQERVSEEMNKMAAEREEEEKRFEREMKEEREKIEERHQETLKELIQRHKDEREELHSTLDKLKEDIALERRQIESSFGLRLRSVEERFELDQEAATQKFQEDVLKLEQNYQDELKIMCEDHEREKCRWEEEMKNAEELKQNMAQILEKEREKMTEEWSKEMQEIDNVHKEEIDSVDAQNKQLQSDLDEIVSRNQLREIELSKQLNELHSRLQESLETKDKLVSQVQKQAIETEKMLRETVQILQVERNELLTNQSELAEKYKEIASISEKQIAERIELITERDGLKMKIEELELSTNKMQADFDVERKNLQRIITDWEEKGAKWSKIKQLEMEVSQVLNFVQNAEIDGVEDEDFEIDAEEIGDCYEITSKFGSSVTNSTKSPSSLDEDSIDILGSPVEDTEIDRNSRNECILNSSESCETMASRDSFENRHCKHQQSQTDEKQCLNCELDENISNCGEKRVLCTSVDPDLTQCPDQKPHCGDPALKDRPGAVLLHAEFQNADEFTRLERLEGANVARDGNRCHNETSCDLKPQYVPDFEVEESFCFHELKVDAKELEDTNNSGQRLEEARCNNDFLMPEISFNHFENTKASSEKQDVVKLRALYQTSTEENVLLQEKVTLLQQKIEILEVLLAHNNEKLKTGHLVLEENYSLKVKLLLLMEHIKELERKTFKMSDLQIRYEDCMCENDKLKEQNAELEKRVWSLESGVKIYGFRDNKVTLTDEINQMRAENRRLSELLEELDSQNGSLLTIRTHSRASTSPVQEETVDFTQIERDDLEDCCDDYEKENAKLRRAIADLQDQSQILSETTKVHRSEACRLSEENLVLKKKIDTLKEEDLKELMKTLDTLKKEKDASQRAADDFKKQISELQSQSVLLENKNGILCEKNFQHLSDVETLKQQMAALAEIKEKTPTKDKKQLSACVSALEAELTKALNETVTLKQRNSLLCLEVSGLREKMKSLESLEHQLSNLSEEKRTLVKETQALCNQLSKAQEKAKASDENLQAVTLQSSRLKADVRVLQQQKDSLQHEVALLHKKLQNANDKNHVLERALHSTGLQSHSKKLLREELSRLMEQEQKLLKQENEKLQGEVHSVKSELRQARDKVRQMDSTVATLKQHKQSHSSMLLALEQENMTLKQELEAQKEKNKGRDAGAGGPDVESILQENEALKSQMARLSTQLIETFQAQLVGLLPPSPHRTPRGQQLRDEAELAQGAVSDQRGAHADSYRRIGGL